jgi:5'-phosphate synthase pdxT subunit
VQLSHPPLQIGVLALQGDYDVHCRILESLGARAKTVRSASDLADLDGLLIPGGESTVMSRLCERYDLMMPLKQNIEEGLPVFGTCAGLIFLATEVEGPSTNFNQTGLNALDVRVARNAYGTQLDSFESEIFVPELGENIRAVFIRAPQIRAVGAGVETLATHGGAPVAVRQGGIMALSFHPEIAGETRLHQMWLESLERHPKAAPIEATQ